METKFNEVVLRTSELDEIKGKFLAERILRKWEEDFVDEGTSEVVSIQRNELLFERGVLMEDDNLTQLNFYLQSGDVKDVLVSNQKRTGKDVEGYLEVYCITIRYGKKKKNYYLYANGIAIALKIATDYLEQKMEGGFYFVSIKESGSAHLINVNEENETEKDVYNIEVEVVFDENDLFRQTYVLKSNDAEEAKDLISKYITLNMKKESEEREFIIKIISAKKIPCNDIIDYNFSKEYLEQKEIEK